MTSTVRVNIKVRMLYRAQCMVNGKLLHRAQYMVNGKLLHRAQYMVNGKLLHRAQYMVNGKFTLFKTYCSSLYCCLMWIKFCKCTVRKVHVAFNKMFKVFLILISNPYTSKFFDDKCYAEI